MKNSFVKIIKSKNGINNLNHFKSNNSSFLFTISYTETATIPGLTIAGANTEMIKYTPAADAEYIHFGKCRCIDTIPATPDGKPTPAIITKTALEFADIPITVIDAGLSVKPLLPLININSKFGKNIALEKALALKDVISNYEMGKLIGKQISKNNDLLIIGESIPGGTTTALGVLLSLGINAYNKVSSSMPENPHELKNKIIKKSLSRSNIKFGDHRNDPFNAISNLGDPMMPTVSGMVEEILSRNKKVILAGGTQMCCIVAILKAQNIKFNDNLCIGTTSYVINDKNSDLPGLISQITDDVPIFYTDLGLENSNKAGLRSYSEGFVKEGAGAGGTVIAAFLKEEYLTQKIFTNKLEENYYNTIEEPVILNTKDQMKTNV
ncbi:MAG: TIGR00303 family protein [Thermoproteota archaeon]|nr:TIGR00303 family protein [Thermoproteota archaeon]